MCVHLWSTGGHLVGYIRKSRLEMERPDFNIKAALEKFVAEGIWTRLPDEKGVKFYETDIGVKNDVGIVVTLRKN